RLPVRAVAIRDGLDADGRLRATGTGVRPHGGRSDRASRRSPSMSVSLAMFLGFVLVTLAITYWASRRTGTTTEFYSAGRRITGFQNGWAVAGDYMSAASFLGIAGLIAFYGY